MKMRISVLAIAVLTMFTVASVAPGGQEEIKKRKTQLQKIKKEIDSYEKKIKDSEKREHANLELLDTYDRQGALLRKLIGKMREDEKLLQEDIDSTRQSIADLSGQIGFLTQQYARYAASAYKHGRTYDLELVLASHSFNQMLLRGEYLRRFSDQRRADLNRIGTQKTKSEEQNALLNQQLSEQRELIASKATEEATLVKKMKRRKSLLTVIRKDKKNYQKEINRRVESARQMEQLIAKLIEEDRERRAKEEARARENNPMASREPSPAGAFDAKRGQLRWPVASGKVVARFGNQENPTLHTVSQNPGIDIAVAAGAEVEAVTEGEVSLISWLPSYGNLVILNHKNGFRTVYAHLSDIFVSEGEKIREGGKLGRSGEGLTGPLLHFEIWKDREKQNPETWLRGKGLSQK